ncbi:60Kd inner membrane protein-domain-containing protein [Lasiosphaeria hispida]|uniref:60Kd inner membrane protein-domain-containing protein n=1 Tax=Lasiosphaeria hispida TaxID=260671 RepID=A0AAJ0HQU3_9PEZI|nr:60Kd inner membrane protein-domain-containing protein [Lasiosphaeria hispida]
MSSEEPANPMADSGVTIPSDSEQYSGEDISTSPPSSSSPAVILYQPPTFWSLLRGAAINLFLPFVNGMMLGFGELFAHEAAFRLGWSGTRVGVPSINATIPLRRAWNRCCRKAEARDQPGRPGQLGVLSSEPSVPIPCCRSLAARPRKKPSLAALLTRKKGFQKPSSRLLMRQFGTALRNNGVSLRGTLNTNASVTRRIAGPLAAAAASQQLLASLRQARYASTQPTAPPVADVPPPPADLFAANPIDLEGAELLNITERIGFLKELGIDFGWGPTSCMQWALEHIYIDLGVPWWAALILMSVAIRAAIFKPSLEASIHSQLLQDLRKHPRYEDAMTRLKAAATSPERKGITEIRREINMMNKAAGVKAWKAFVPMINIPIGFGVLRLFRAMSNLPVPSLETGGILWFTDLTVADPYYILPAIAGVVFAVAMRVPLPYMAPAQQKTMKVIGVFLIPLSFVFTMYLPSGLQLYFLVSGGLQWFQSAVFYNKWFRRIAGMQPLRLGGAGPSGVTAQGAWQAPRVVDTTATTESDKNFVAPLYDTIKEGISTAKEKLDERAETGNKKSTLQAVKEYNERRALEDKEDLVARRRAALMKRKNNK